MEREMGRRWGWQGSRGAELEQKGGRLKTSVWKYGLLNVANRWQGHSEFAVAPSFYRSSKET